jgi:hypothetical protein
MNQEPNSEAAETVQTTNVPAVDLPRLVRLFNEYGSSAQSDHADAVDKIMDAAMDKLAVYLAENNVCPRDAMGYCVMIVTQHLSAYGLRRAMGMKRREREMLKALESIAGYTPDKMSGFECKEIAAEALESLPNDLAVAPPPQRPATGRDVPGG